MTKSVYRLLAVAALSVLIMTGQAQTAAKETRPYKVLTSGRQLTIKSIKTIQHIMLWTTGGDRVVEQKDINNNSFTTDIPISRKAFFLMVGLANGKVYTEKIGIQ
ncbi:MAG: hypothetical protein ACT4OJ_00485 [Bacteroidota bacterium]